MSFRGTSNRLGSSWNKKNSFWLAKCSVLLKWNSFLRKSEVFKNCTSSVTRNKIGLAPRYWRHEEKVGKNFWYSTKEHMLQRIIFPSIFFNMIRVSMVVFSDSATEPRRISLTISSPMHKPISIQIKILQLENNCM